MLQVAVETLIIHWVYNMHGILKINLCLFVHLKLYFLIYCAYLDDFKWVMSIKITLNVSYHDTPGWMIKLVSGDPNSIGQP